MKKYFANKKGISVLEMLIALFLILLFSSISYNSFIKTIPKRSVNHASWELMSHLRSARMIAIRSNSRCVVYFNGKSLIYENDTNENGFISFDEREILDFPNPEVQITRLTDSTMAFTSTGRFIKNVYPAKISYEEFTISHPAWPEKRVVSVYSGGQVRLHKPIKD